MTLRTRLVGESVVVDVRGQIDVSSTERLRTTLVDLVNDVDCRLVVNLDETEFIDSTGLGVLVGVLKRVRARDGSLALVCGNDDLLRVFEMTGLTKVFAIHASVVDATSSASH